jgi:hypothetical protein
LGEGSDSVRNRSRQIPRSADEGAGLRNDASPQKTALIVRYPDEANGIRALITGTIQTAYPRGSRMFEII